MLLYAILDNLANSKDRSLKLKSLIDILIGSPFILIFISAEY
jgi:hypothetical protein